MKYAKTCDCCGVRSTVYCHKINKSMANAFISFVDFYLQTGLSVKISDQKLGLTHNQIANFQKLKYFGLVKSVCGKNGLWVPTLKGIRFYRNQEAVLMPAATLNGELIADNHEAWSTHSSPREKLFINDITDLFYKERAEYQAEKSAQNILF